MTHGYLPKKLEHDEIVDMKRTNKWLNVRFTAHIEGSITTAQEQKLSAKETQKRREKDLEKKDDGHKMQNLQPAPRIGVSCDMVPALYYLNYTSACDTIK